MDTFRKWLNKPKADDKSLLARFYHADRSLTAIASELDSFDGRAEPDRCSRLVSRLRQGQDKVLAITNLIMEELLGEDRDPRAFRAKFPEEVLQENLAGQLWFGAECLAAGSSIMNREQESKRMRPLAQAVTKSLGTVRTLLRDQCLRSNVPNSKTLHLDTNDSNTEQLYESLKIFDRLFAQFELCYVSAMVQVKTKHEYEMQELICVLFSETLQRALKVGLLDQEKVDAFDPALMFSIPRLAIISGLVIYSKGPLNMDMPADQLSEMFRPFRTILIKIRDLLRTLSKNELLQLEKLLCTNEDIHLKIPVGTSSIEAPSPDQQNNNSNTNNNSNNCDGNNGGDEDGSGDGSSITTTQKLSNSAIEQRNNNNTNTCSAIVETTTTTTTATITTTNSTPMPSTSPKKVLRTASGTTDSPYACRYATRSPSISSVSADSSAASTPTATPSPSPTPSHSIASTTSAASSTTSPAEWSDEDEDDDHDEGQDEHDVDVNDNEDILSADCASGYLIPNTNFGNLLQPQEVPLTDNFIASEDDEFGGSNQVDSTMVGDVDDDDDANVPTTSAAVRRLRLNDSSASEESEQLTMKASANRQNAESNDTLYGSQLDKSLDGNGSIGSGDSSKHNISSNSNSSSCSNATCNSSSPHPQHHHRRRSSHHQVEQHGGDSSNDSTTRPSHHHHHHHHHHNHSNSHSHHHHHHRSKNHHHSKAKHCSLDAATASAAESSSMTKEEYMSITDSPPTAATIKGPSKPSAINVHHDTSSVDSSTSSSLSDADSHEVSLAVKAAGRMKFKSTENLLHRLFVCIAGVADQLQTNFAADLRKILRSVFLMNMSPAQEELDIPEKTKESELFEFRASENDVIQESAGSNQSIYSAEEVNPELDSVFNNSNGGGGHSSSSSSSSGSGGGARHSTGGGSGGSAIQRGNTIDLGGASEASTAAHGVRNHVGRSRSLGDHENNETAGTTVNTTATSSNRHVSSFLTYSGNHQRMRNNSVGSNSPSSTNSSSSESNSPVCERASNGFQQAQTRQSLNSSSNINNNNSLDITASNTVAGTITVPPSQSAITTTPSATPPRTTITSPSARTVNTRLAPPAWVPDDKAPRCMSCQTPFTAFRRRHHCRNCGGVFCGACSNASAPLPKYGLTKAVRVCRDCFAREVRANTAGASRNNTAAGRNTAAVVSVSPPPNAAAHSPPTTTAGGS